MAYILLSIVSFSITWRLFYFILLILKHVLKRKMLFRVQKDNLGVLWFFSLVYSSLQVG